MGLFGKKNKSLKPSEMTGERGSAPARKSDNPVIQWVDERKEERSRKIEENAKQLSNNRAENEEKMISMLESINFVSSLLPPKYIDFKSNETQPYGDLEFAVQTAIGFLKNNTGDYVGLDISKIDAMIITMIQELKNAVDAGNVNRAFAAKSSIITCIDSIRDKIPTVPEEMQAQFIESSEKYLEMWLTLISASNTMDGLETNLKQLESDIENKKQENDVKLDEWAERLNIDDDFKRKFVEISNNTKNDNGEEWDDETQEIYQWLVSQRIFQSSLDFEKFRLSIVQKQYNHQKKIVDDLQVDVSNVPIPTDPNMMNKYMDMVESVFEKAASVDAEFAELGQFMDNVDARIKQMSTSQGSLAMDRMADKSLTMLVKRANKLRKVKEGIIEGDADKMNLIRELGLYTEEQVNEMKEEQENILKEIEKQEIKEQERSTNTTREKIRI